MKVRRVPDIASGTVTLASLTKREGLELTPHLAAAGVLAAVCGAAVYYLLGC